MISGRILAALCVLWLALWAPLLNVHYAYHWDSSQFARGEDHFDIAHHQPQPPGYPLWVFAARQVRGLTGNAYTAQIALAFAFTLAGLALFRLLTGNWTPVLLLAFSPVVMLCAGVSLTYAVDLFASSLAAWLAWQWWRGDGRRAVAGCVALAVTMGFRPSGVTFLLPLVAVALVRLAKTRPALALSAAATGVAAAALWYVPTAASVGGFTAYSTLNRAQLLDTASKTSVFLGAPLAVHLKMLVEFAIYLAMGAIALAPLIVARVLRGAGKAATRRGPLFYALWIGPCLAFLLAVHCPAPGYLVLLLPPVVMLGWEWAGEQRFALAGVALALIAAWFPYSALLGRAPFIPVYLVMRSTPALARTVESMQRELRERLDKTSAVVCVLNRPEAPNFRTVTYDFPDVQWIAADDPRALHAATALLCEAEGPPPELRAAYPHARRIAGNELYSLWLTN